jgi:FlaA1/EpsC-like NDP-sugar epimerase
MEKLHSPKWILWRILNMKWEDLTVLITGGTGSFGWKFREIMLRDFHPKKLNFFSRDELKQHEMRHLPIFPRMEDADVEDVIRAVEKIGFYYERKAYRLPWGY